MPHFGPTLLLTAPETSLQKLPPSFADGAFHLGWAELDHRLAAAPRRRAARGVDRVRRVRGRRHASIGLRVIQRDIRAALSNRRRCYVEESDGRFVFQNFRRGTTGQPKRIALG